MFYCNECAIRLGYPISIFKSVGNCEICTKEAICNDVKSSNLPKPKETHEETKKRYPVIDVPASGKPDWYEGAYTLVFVYSKHKGNFILRGYRGEVEKYLKANYTHYFCYISMWSDGRSRGHWDFWKENIGIFSPSKGFKCWKYQVRQYSTGKSLPEKILYFKRMPKRWIPEFDKL